MTRLFFITALLLLCFAASLGQSETAFTVKKPEVNVTLQPAIDTLLPNTDYVFKIAGIAAKDIDTISFTGGAVKLKGQELIMHTKAFATDGNTYTLRIFAKPHNKVLQIDFATITYEKVSLPAAGAPAFIDDVFYLASYNMNEAPVSTALVSGDKYSAKVFKTYNNLFALSPNSNYEVSIVSYIVVIKCGESEEMFTISGGSFDRALNKRVAGLTDGCSLTFDKIKYMRREGSADARLHGPITIYIKD